MANRNWSSGGKVYSMHTSPVLIDCNFVVDNTQTTGISSLKGPTVASVLMNSVAATPSMVIAAGTILVKLQDAYNRVFAGISGQVISPGSGSSLKIDNAALTIGVAYQITTVGNATAAQLQAVGMPRGMTPAVGVSFIATSTGIAGNVLTTRVQAAASSNICQIELAADPSLTCSPNPSANQGYGAYLILQCRDYAGALVAPTAGSKISLEMYFSNSSVTTQGE